MRRTLLKNFKFCGFLGLMPRENGCFLRAFDKMSRMAQYFRTGVFEVESESLEDTIVDAINYLCLFYALVVEKRGMRSDVGQTGVLDVKA